ncbi:MAG: glycosyltransferase [Burkholderiaceae bacterium]|nr:glycosyltransferase [Burkholderiaceae bacterium]
MKVWQISRDDNTGGASRSAYRLHVALSLTGVESRMRVLNRETPNDLVFDGVPPRQFAQRVRSRVERMLRDRALRKFRTDNLIMHSFGQESAGLVDELNASDADVLNLHWIAKLLSISDIGRLRKPLVWTLHDMWAFCGGEHVVADDAHARFRLGYLPGNRPPGEGGPDLNRIAWETKRRAWAEQTFTIVTPGRWMARCARESVLFRNSPVHVIPNPLEMTELWRPIPQRFARMSLGLDPNKQFVLAGSAGGMPHLKGEDLLRKCMEEVSAVAPGKAELLVFGQNRPAIPGDWPCPVHWLGSVRDDHTLAMLYSAADVTVVPSRQDNLPNTAIESHACGTPVVAFAIGGLPDIVTPGETGWLASPFDTHDLAQGVLWVLGDQARWSSLSGAARVSALAKYSPQVVAAQYLSVYDGAFARR